MKENIAHFKRTCFSVGSSIGIRDATIVREYGLSDFLGNCIEDGDDDEEIALQAILYFCRGHTRQEKQYQFGVYVVCLFLHQHTACLSGHPPARIIEELNKLIAEGCIEGALRGWIQSNFPPLF